MMKGLYFKFHVGLTDILVPAVELTEARKFKNLYIYGTEYGIKQIIVDEGGGYRTLVTSNEVIKI